MNDIDADYLYQGSRINNYSVIPNAIYQMNISSTAMILYAKLLNRAQLSVTNNYFDEEGRAYVLYTLEDLAAELHKSVSSIKTNMNELVEAGLVEKRRCDRGRANMIFVKVPTSSMGSQKTTSYESDYKPYMGSNTGSYRGRKQAPNNNKKIRNINTYYQFEEGESL